MKKPINRTKAASVNATTMMITQLIGLVLKFGVQTAFIHQLSRDYLGLNGLFSNVVSFLSFADLGIGTAITVALYKPIAEDDEVQLLGLLEVFRKAYRYIIVCMSVVGIGVAPVIHLFIKDSPFSAVKISLWFLIYFAAMVASYFSAYKRSFLMAAQVGYLSSLNDFVFKSLQQVTQIFVIVVWHSFGDFLIIQAVAAIVSNWQLSHMVVKRYPGLFTHGLRSHHDVPAATISAIKKNTVGALSSKIGEIVVFGTDNVILSSFIGLVSVAKYSNYMLIVQSLNSLIGQVLGTFVASIGNLHATASAEWQAVVAYRLQYLSALLNVFITVGLAFACNIFINLWAGSAYLLSPLVSALIVINFSITQSRYTALNFISGMGLYWNLRTKSIIEAIVNLILSILFVAVFHMGILGVVVGTLCSNMIINILWEPWVVFHEGLHISMKPYLMRYVFYQTFTMLVAFGLTYGAERFVGIGILPLLGLLIVVEVLVVGLFVLITSRTREFKYVKQLVLTKVLHRAKGR